MHHVNLFCFGSNTVSREESFLPLIKPTPRTKLATMFARTTPAGAPMPGKMKKTRASSVPPAPPPQRAQAASSAPKAYTMETSTLNQIAQSLPALPPPVKFKHSTSPGATNVTNSSPAPSTTMTNPPPPPPNKEQLFVDPNTLEEGFNVRQLACRARIAQAKADNLRAALKQSMEDGTLHKDLHPQVPQPPQLWAQEFRSKPAPTPAQAVLSKVAIDSSVLPQPPQPPSLEVKSEPKATPTQAGAKVLMVNLVGKRKNKKQRAKRAIRRAEKVIELIDGQKAKKQAVHPAKMLELRSRARSRVRRPNCQRHCESQTSLLPKSV